MNKDHQTALDKARTAALNLKKQADTARTLGLTVLEQWLREASVGCQAGADFQVRAMGDNLSTQTQQVVVESTPAYCSQCGCAFSVAACGPTHALIWSERQKQADVIADAMKRKGLV